MSNVNQKHKDEELVALAQAGDKNAMEELLRRHLGLVRSCARGFFLIGGETEDLLQEGTIALYRAVLEYKVGETGCSFKNFAYTCVSRRIIDAVKRAASKKNSPLNAGVFIPEEELIGTKQLTPEDILILSDERKELRQEMTRTLSDFEFKVMTMYMDGMTCDEICEATGKSAKSVDNALQRSKRKLQAVLKK